MHDATLQLALANNWRFVAHVSFWICKRHVVYLHNLKLTKRKNHTQLEATGPTRGWSCRWCDVLWATSGHICHPASHNRCEANSKLNETRCRQDMFTLGSRWHIAAGNSHHGNGWTMLDQQYYTGVGNQIFPKVTISCFDLFTAHLCLHTTISYLWPIYVEILISHMRKSIGETRPALKKGLDLPVSLCAWR